MDHKFIKLASRIIINTKNLYLLKFEKIEEKKTNIKLFYKQSNAIYTMFVNIHELFKKISNLLDNTYFRYENLIVNTSYIQQLFVKNNILDIQFDEQQYKITSGDCERLFDSLESFLFKEGEV